MAGNVPCDYVIRVEGYLTERWSDWFEGLKLKQEPGGTTLITGNLPDQAALFGVINKIHSLNLILLSVEGKPPV